MEFVGFLMQLRNLFLRHGLAGLGLFILSFAAIIGLSALVTHISKRSDPHYRKTHL